MTIDSSSSRASVRALAVDCVGLCASYDSAGVIDNANLQVFEGELCAVAGPSGSGKSTLLHCLSGILVPDAGRIVVGGQDLTRMSDAERSRFRRTTVSLVFQFGQLIPELTIQENVALPLLLGGTHRKSAIAQARTWTERFGIGHLDEKFPGETSGGESQRAAVARAFVCDPAVILADEPTGSLDSETAQTVLDAFVGAASETNTAVLLVTHDRSVAAQADRCVFMRDGSIQTEPVQLSQFLPSHDSAG